MTHKIKKTILFSREQAKELGEAIRKSRCHYNIIDLSEVHFVSRSFADEWLNIIKRISSDKSLTYKNMNPEIKKMIAVVKRKKQQINKAPVRKTPV
jgi:anti-anti-sigma regulatory factor